MEVSTVHRRNALVLKEHATTTLPPAQLFIDSRRVTGVQGHVGQSSLTQGIPSLVRFGEETAKAL